MSSFFIDDQFLLDNKSADILYHSYAESMPIIDYHCHIPPKEIADDLHFENITKIWLDGDHYKWRAMRTAGVDEKYITGSAVDRDKFIAWARTVPQTLGNPLFHWTHLELKDYFGIEELLNGDSAPCIWEKCNSMLKEDDLSTRGILKKMNVQVVCTTDDPVDSLEYHEKIAADKNFPVRVLPAFRPDKAMQVDKLPQFNLWVDKLEASTGKHIGRYDDFLGALKSRHDFFHEHGCRLSDHGIDRPYADDFTHSQVSRIFNTLRAGKPVNIADQSVFKSAMLYEFGVMDHQRGWVQQYHLGAVRNVNTRMYEKLGPDTGFDSIGDYDMAAPLAKMLDRLDRENHLTQTILYNVNPNDNPVMATMIGNFQDGSRPGKMQFGSAWWYLDQKNGIEDQLRTLANMGLLSRFVGMLTDSRSFLSYPRHEYFRRVLCNMLGSDMEKGLLPDDIELIGAMIRDICYNNAKYYFDFEG